MDILQCIYSEAADRLHRKKNECESYAALLQAYGETVECMEKVLGEERRRLLFELEARRNLLAAEDEEWMFQWGFRMGAKLMAEILLTTE